MKIVIPGGSGQVGTVLARAFYRKGHEVIVLTRKPVGAAWRTVAWDGRSMGEWSREIDGCDVVINLAGRSVNCRYNQANRREIVESRVFSTRVVGEAIAQARRPPRVWLQSSTATIYAHRFDAANDEFSGGLGGDEPGSPRTWKFSIDVALAWEREFNSAPALQTRKVLLRSAMTMSPDKGGVFETLLTLVRLGLGGPAGDGKQYVSWIHHQDFVRALEWIIDHPSLNGEINVAAPNPLPNKDFMQALRSAAGVSIGLPARKWMLEVGAVFLRTETELILKSRRVIPARLLQSGFTFEFPYWSDAAYDLCGRSIAQAHGSAA